MALDRWMAATIAGSGPTRVSAGLGVVAILAALLGGALLTYWLS